ncbi:hypothetical protein F8388_008495 [Cannabis sativa]|uniref:Uncharacterized protein n=1 Tax=Cannabis sativa TaxID=3483 RepID=A0A7J6EHS4_CANSA|nr:hypothetical protein F8388_008495 [Cannabis sativa]
MGITDEFRPLPWKNLPLENDLFITTGFLTLIETPFLLSFFSIEHSSSSSSSSSSSLPWLRISAMDTRFRPG